ncbi:MAG: hypothetical protein KAH38_13495, partial [Candidatus Hydrogenedentes bacterium]|nr:hypothetical protein [Candidatus Hydrogenedentota bacterium]
MKAAIIILAVTMVLVGVSAYATPPTYEGQFGNPEEPALRIIKWPWLGFRKLVVRTHEGLQSGLEKESLSSTGYEGTCGAWDGSKTFVEHTASGLVYAPLPGKASLRKSDTYEKQVMSFIEVVTKPVCEEQASAA